MYKTFITKKSKGKVKNAKIGLLISMLSTNVRILYCYKYVYVSE